MSEPQDTSPRNPADPPRTQQQAERLARAERVAAALRENLRKRKQQARVRAARPAPDPDGQSS